jgi:hypothetical protein
MGDCGGDKKVSIDELTRSVGIVLGSMPINECPTLAAKKYSLSVHDVVRAVHHALQGCP